MFTKSEVFFICPDNADPLVTRVIGRPRIGVGPSLEPPVVALVLVRDSVSVVVAG